MLLKVLPMLWESPVIRMMLFGLPCVMYSMLVLTERNDSAIGDFGELMTTKGSLPLDSTICPMIGNRVSFSTSLRSMTETLKKSLRVH